MPLSTKKYLQEKERLKKSIDWYHQTIEHTDQVQISRRNTLADLMDSLFKLEEDYYTNG